MSKIDRNNSAVLKNSHKTYKEKRYDYLVDYKPELYHCLIQKNQLIMHLKLIQQRAENREKQIIEKLIEAELQNENNLLESPDLNFEKLRTQAQQIVEIEIIKA